jgi:hypothetical protein
MKKRPQRFYISRLPSTQYVYAIEVQGQVPGQKQKQKLQKPAINTMGPQIGSGDNAPPQINVPIAEGH